MIDLTGTNGTRLVYFGVRHTFNPDDPQIGEMQQRWRELKPTEAFYEGTGTGVGATLAETVTKAGEPGVVRFLGSADKIPTNSLEPTHEQEVTALVSRFTGEQVVLFFVARAVEEAHDRLHWSPTELESYLARRLAQEHAVRALRDVLPTPNDFRVAYQRWFPGADPLDAPARWFDPARTSGETGSRFLNDVNAADSAFRDIHMYRTLATAAMGRRRIFAEVGRDHIPAQTAALRCVLGQ